MRKARQHAFVLAAGGLTLALAVAARAETGDETGASAATITVHRGAQVSSVSNGVESQAGPEAASPQGVSVVRGHGRATAEAAPGVSPPQAAEGGPLMAAGDVVWLIDRGDGRLIACELVETADLGVSKIRCRARDLPQ